jgi:mRNA-degrading endonuclease YafQ of YafQ-DinJ toxin-antitoxin module
MKSAKMNISFDDPKHEKLVNDFDELARKFDKKGRKIAQEIIATIDVLRAAITLFDVPPSFRPHPLKGDYKGHFAVDVTRTHRAIFKPNHKEDPNFRIDNYKSIKSIIIVEIFTDYH